MKVTKSGCLYGIINPHTYEVTTYEVIKPPKGESLHKGYIETSSGRKEIKKFPDGTFEIVDCETGAVANAEPSDIAAYFG